MTRQISPAEILAETRLQLRGTSEPVPDPKPLARATRLAHAAIDRIDAGEVVFAGGLGVRLTAGGYQLGPLDPVGREEALVTLFDLYGGHR